MHFLINEKDYSVNNASAERQPDWMVHEGLIRKEFADEDLPDVEDKTLLMYDPVSESMVDLGNTLVTQRELQAYIDEQQALNAALSKTSESKYGDIVALLKTLFPDDPRIDEIVQNDEITLDEFAEIEAMLASEE